MTSRTRRATSHQLSCRLARPVAVVALGWGLAYLGWRAAATFAGSNPVAFAALISGEAFGWLSLLAFCFLAWRVEPLARPAAIPTKTVDVLVCTYDESIEVLQATLVGCGAIRYRHNTWVLDDGHRPAVAELADRLGVGYISRPHNRHAKAGNVNHALSHTEGELILVLDADHVPMPGILDATLGYFEDPEVACVQTPQDFANHDSFQHHEEGRHDQSLFYEVICPAKDRHGAAFWCGSGAVLRRSALLSVGGVATETVAEDFHTTIKLHAAGWRTRYHHETLVQGIAPHDLSSYLLQRERWARGNLAVLRTAESPLTCRGLTVAERCSYMASLLAYFAPLQRVVLIGVLAALLTGAVLPARASVAGFATFWLPWMMLSLIASKLLARGWTRLSDEAMSLWMTAGVFSRAVLGLLRPSVSRFKVTPKEGVDEGGWPAVAQLRLVLVTGAVLGAALLARLLALAGVAPLPSLGGLALGVGLFFGFYELALLGRVIWVVARRHQMRVHYRIPTQRPGVIGDALVRVVDLTPYGAGVVSPREVAAGSAVSLSVELGSVEGRPRKVPLSYHVSTSRQQADGLWRLGGAIEPVREDGMAALLEHCQLVEPLTRLGYRKTSEAAARALEEMTAGGSGDGESGWPTALGLDPGSNVRWARPGPARVKAPRAADIVAVAEAAGRHPSAAVTRSERTAREQRRERRPR